ncbi:dihydroneopterin aldolase [Pedobacter sp.]|uniref:dihydroneopterin aldolase n=1 Tax=Pedobacter sp. TaxID=1411316 RepID=UPI00396C8F28
MFTQTVALKDVKFYAFHGLYPEEQLTGNHFIVDVEVAFEPKGNTEDLERTVNYEVLNQILIEEMRNTQKLLETVVRNMIDKILSTYIFIDAITIGIRKINPPMPGQVGHSFVQLKYQCN